MRKTGILAAGVALALTVVGCGSKETGSPVAAGSGNGTTSSSAEAESKGFGSALDLAKAINDKSDSAKSAKIAMTAEGAGETMKMDGAVQMGASPAMKMTMDVGPMKMEMVLVDKVLYMKMPQGTAPAGSKPWFKIEPGGSDPISKQMGPMLEQIDDSFDVRKQMEQLKTAGTITKQEKTTLDGEEATHYWITLDMTKMAESSDPSVKKSAEEASKAGMSKLDMEMWTNSEDLPAKITTKIPAGGTTMSMVVTYKDWGKPVEISAPPADQVGAFPK